MRAGLDLDTLFPIEDAASARLMLVKASCLRKAGVIDEAETAANFVGRTQYCSHSRAARRLR